MNKHKILFPIEITVRELIYKIALAIKFADCGHECYLGSKGHMLKLFDEVSPFVYFDKGYHEDVSEDLFYKPVKSRGGFLVSLDEEGGVDTEDFHSISRRYPDKIFDYFGKLFIWGSEQNNFLKENRSKHDKEKFIVSGHPRFELLKNMHLSIYEDELNSIKSRYDKYILVNTNTKYANHIKGKDFLVKEYGHRVKAIEKKFTYDQQKFDSMVSMIKKLADAIDYNIIIRPHPEEDITTFRNIFSSFTNVHCVYEKSVIPWIIGSEVVIHNDCTTALESSMLGKPTIAYNNIIDVDLSPLHPIDVSHKIDDENEIINFIQSNGYLNLKKYKGEILEDYFSFSKDSVNIIVKETNLYLDSQKRGKEKNLSFSFVLKEFFVESIKSPLRYVLNFFKEGDKLSKNKLSYFDSKTFVNSTFEKVYNNISPKNKIYFTKVSPLLYKISKR